MNEIVLAADPRLERLAAVFHFDARGLAANRQGRATASQMRPSWVALGVLGVAAGLLVLAGVFAWRAGRRAVAAACSFVALALAVRLVLSLRLVIAGRVRTVDGVVEAVDSEGARAKTAVVRIAGLALSTTADFGDAADVLRVGERVRVHCLALPNATRGELLSIEPQ